jgi:hypothetical protein
MNNLPSQPGLRRRLAYGEHIRRRHNLELNGQRMHIYNALTDGTYEMLANLPKVPVGLNVSELLRGSSLQVIKEKSYGICVICQEDICKEAIARVLSCNHGYHSNCIDVWFCENNKCPLCGLSLRH